MSRPRCSRLTLPWLAVRPCLARTHRADARAARKCLSSPLWRWRPRMTEEEIQDSQRDVVGEDEEDTAEGKGFMIGGMSSGMAFGGGEQRRE